MGQQQLLLLVLGIVIVGLAVVVGINAFSENRIKSNADALVTDGLRIASDIQAWALKPVQFGGGNDGIAESPEDDMTGVDFDDIGYPNDGTNYSNVNGTFGFTDGSGGTVTCTSPGATSPLATLYGWNDETGNCVQIEITGTRSDDIFTEVTYGS